MSTWRKSGLANYKKRHSELSKRFHIGWIYIYRGLLYSRVFATWIIYPRRLHWSTCKQREDVFPRSTHDPTFRWKENRMSVRNGHVYGCMGFPFPLHAVTSSEIFLSLRENPSYSSLFLLRFRFLSFSSFFLQISNKYPFSLQQFLSKLRFHSREFYPIFFKYSFSFERLPLEANNSRADPSSFLYNIPQHIYIYIFRDVLFSRYELLL